MAPKTEAACLLESGTTYGKRTLLRPESGDPIFAGFRPGVFSLYFGDAPIFHFDRDGRWQRAFVAGVHYLKGLDARIQAIDRVREGENLVLKRRTLGGDEARAFDETVRSSALGVLDALDSRGLEPFAPPSPTPELTLDELRDALERAARWDEAAWADHFERYRAAYGHGPLPFLPPDAQGALIVQATVGHARGVAFGRGAPVDHRARSPAEFVEHVEAVRRLLGRRIAQCRGVFLAGSDALRQPPEAVVAALGTIASTFPIDPDAARRGAGGPVDASPALEGVDTFLDDFAPPLPDRLDWRSFRSLHLRRVSLGVESGDPDVRSLYRKTWKNDDLRAIVADIKDAGLAVGLLVLVDAGGAEHATRHIEATAGLVNTLPLGPGDLVFLLDGTEFVDPRLGPDDLGFTPLTGRRRSEQQAELKRLLLPVRTVSKAKVAPYSLEKQGV